VTPLFVVRTIPRRFSTARTQAMRRCCSAAAEWPNQPSFEIFMKSWAPFSGEAANLARVNRFVANEDTKRIAVRKLADGVLGAFAKAADFARNIRHHTVNQGKRLVLAEWDEVNFVVRKLSTSLRSNISALLYGAITVCGAAPPPETVSGFHSTTPTMNGCWKRVPAWTPNMRIARLEKRRCRGFRQTSRSA